ncbi:MAG: preprotein translocase subunit Sec61beta [Acidilobus sp.]
MSERGERKARSRKRKEAGPLTAAGLVAFYENYRGKVEISPTTLLIISAVIAAAVILARALFH